MSEKQQKSWADEALSSIIGAFDLLMRDEQGMQKFNLSANGFWRSFGAILIIIPIYLFAASTDWSAAAGGEPGDFSAIRSLISLSIQWVVWPVVALYLLRALSVEKFYARYITVFNWTMVVAMIISAVPSIVIATGLAWPQAVVFLSFMLLFITLYFEWYITSKSLGTPMGVTAAIVAADFVVSLAIGTVFG